MLPIIMGCNKAEIETQPHQLKNCTAGYLLFSDNMQSILNSSFIYPPNSGSTVFDYVYQNNKVVRVNGGFIPIPSGTSLLGKEEIIFQDYDQKPNPFKNMYHVTGAFYRAFSKNNYTRYQQTFRTCNQGNSE